MLRSYRDQILSWQQNLATPWPIINGYDIGVNPSSVNFHTFGTDWTDLPNLKPNLLWARYELEQSNWSYLSKL